MRGLFFMVMCVLLVGCGSTKPTKQTTRTVKDSTSVETTFHKRDTTIVVPGDTTRIRVPVTEITETPIRKKSGRTTAVVSQKDGQLDVQCLTDSLSQQLELLDKRIRELTVREDKTTETIRVPERFIPWYAKTLAWIGGAALLAMLGFLAFKFI